MLKVSVLKSRSAIAFFFASGHKPVNWQAQASEAPKFSITWNCLLVVISILTNPLSVLAFRSFCEEHPDERKVNTTTVRKNKCIAITYLNFENDYPQPGFYQPGTEIKFSSGLMD